MRLKTLLWRERALNWLWVLCACAVLAACAAPRRAPAPVEDRVAARHPTAVATETTHAGPLPGAENAGKPGYYTVRPGDTLLRIALESGQNWRDIARWNGLDNPNVIEVGQVLRVGPPPGGTAVAVAPPASSPASAPAPAVAAQPPASAASSAPRPVASAAPAPAPAPSSTPAPTPPASTGPDDDIAWGWPTVGAGTVLAGFDEQKNKGLDIGGRAGDPVLAAADGRVVYAGAGLRGYGNLIILKHNNTYLTAYAHNQSLLVKEDQAVRKGQKIAEMGSTDTDRVKLHFEIRRQGKPVDPTRYLPAK
ncbi:peptidoglycan DD-metalloendopeptidase family protein [Ramlibacter ginsenosidimutans]|uniref:Peptidoglycan DD-metalloendopeptidase family protein n=3 Tax=Ramlibacter ginsenosidimutans TaxID=502333 RepID=A0A934TV51_9BURK|nr:peptidoglycan DD-metalloendopeptidase family protein [Ramlibacter ginsenosidimutans]MBK6007405.1 peptidoglycan DD-metalloendopeptidase family protein [Ramlibacter ginsenosidimutans]